MTDASRPKFVPGQSNELAVGVLKGFLGNPLGGAVASRSMFPSGLRQAADVPEACGR